MPRWGRITAAGWLVAAAFAAPAAANEPPPFASVGENTWAPIGWVELCGSRPWECSVAPVPPREVVLTSKAWDTLIRVNRYVNKRIRSMTDIEHYGVVEKWAYPDDGYGDCEDYVLLKRRMLLEAGWPRDALLITVVRDRKGHGHAVLTVKTDQGEFVLDNESKDVMLWSETGYRFVTRQSQWDPSTWVLLNGPRDVPVGTIAAKASVREGRAPEGSARGSTAVETSIRAASAGEASVRGLTAVDSRAPEAAAGEASARGTTAVETSIRAAAAGEASDQVTTAVQASATEAAVGETSARGTTAIETSVPGAAVGEARVDNVRDVTPPGFAHVLRSADQVDVPAETARRFANVRVRYDGLLQANGDVIALFGVSIPDRRQLCTTNNGARWACGQRAFMALRTLVESREIACEVRNDTSPIIAQCRKGNTDIGLSLIRDGWAELSKGMQDRQYVDALTTAKQQKLGVWADTISTNYDGYGYQ